MNIIENIENYNIFKEFGKYNENILENIWNINIFFSKSQNLKDIEIKNNLKCDLFNFHSYEDYKNIDSSVEIIRIIDRSFRKIINLNSFIYEKEMISININIELFKINPNTFLKEIFDNSFQILKEIKINDIPLIDPIDNYIFKIKSSYINNRFKFITIIYKNEEIISLHITKETNIKELNNLFLD